MASEKNLRILILLLYGVALAHMLWTGEIYRFVGGWLVPWLWACCAVIWLLAIGMVAALRGAPKTSAHADVTGDAKPFSIGWDVTQGVLYALFTLPPVIYLLGVLTGDLRWY